LIHVELVHAPPADHVFIHCSGSLFTDICKISFY